MSTEAFSAIPTCNLINYKLITFISADGQRRTFAAVNRQFPGPSIELCEGDKLEVEVTNSMHASETPITIHWHGQHQHVQVTWMEFPI